MGLFGLGKDKELSELRSVLKTSYRTKLDPIGEVKDRLAELKAETYQDYEPPVYGLRLWWVLGYEGEKEHIDGPYYTASDADRKLATYDDGEIFELRGVDAKSKAKEVIKDILKKRKEEAEAFLQGRMAPPSDVAPKRVSRKLAEPQRRGKFSKDGRYPES